MKQTTRRSAVSTAILTTLVVALSQTSRPAEIRAHEDEECGPDYYAVCSVIETKKCLFWIFFCDTVTETVFYGDVYY